MSRNEITGDEITTKATSEAYRDNWERIFGAKSTERMRQVFQDLAVQKVREGSLKESKTEQQNGG